MGNSILKSGTVEEKLARADKALIQLERRILARTIVAPLTPIVVMGYCEKDDNGVIARGVLPVSGFVTKVSVFIEKIDQEDFLKKNNLEFTVEINQADGTSLSKTFASKKMAVNEPSSMKMAADSRIKVLINTPVTGVYYGLVLEPEAPIRRKVEFESET